MKNELHIRLERLGLRLPDLPIPRGNYAGVTTHNGIAYLSGQVSRLEGDVITGPVDHKTAAHIIKLAAETCLLRALSALTAVGDAYSFDRALFLRGYVNAAPGFSDHSAVLDGASDLLHAIFGERGSHSRSAIGVASLPSAGLLEIELVVALTARSRQGTEPTAAASNLVRMTGGMS